MWATEAVQCREDGYPGAAAYCWAQLLKEHPEQDGPLIRSIMADLMAEQLGYIE